MEWQGKKKGLEFFIQTHVEAENLQCQAAAVI